MIIFGTRARYKTVDTGQFHCPHCQKEREYHHKQGKNYFSLYFIPVLPIGDANEFVECQTCKRTYSTEAINFKPSKPQNEAARLLNDVKRKLELGLSVEYVIADLTSDGLEREIAENMITMVIGDERKICPRCELTYPTTMETCPEDKTPLKSL